MLRRIAKRAELQPSLAILAADGGVHGRNLWTEIAAHCAVQPARNQTVAAGSIRKRTLSHRQQLRRQQPVRLRVKWTAVVGRVLLSSMMGVVPVESTCECQAS